MAIWLSAVIAGFGWLLQYSNTQGEDENSFNRPTNSVTSESIASAANFRLLVFLHPHCPCSRSTLAELARLLPRTNKRLLAEAICVCPAGTEEGWRNSELERMASAIPDVTVRWDMGGNEARRYGARTSGHVFLLDGGGTVRFSGGITPSRGHEGDNQGLQAILSMVANDSIARATSPIFGCPLIGSAPEGGSK